LTLSSLFTFAQAPNNFKYQSVVRNNTGSIISNQNVSFKISILHNTITGNSVYSEIQNATTNQFGLANLNVGTGNIVSGNINSINWADSTYFIKIEMDATGGSNYIHMGTSQLLSVPYSLYANKCGEVENPNYIITGVKEMGIMQGQNDSSQILNCLQISGNSSNVNLSVIGTLPAGCTLTFSNSPIPFNSSTHIYLTTNSTTPIGVYPLVLNSTLGNITKQYPFNLQVYPIPNPCPSIFAGVFNGTDICASNTTSYSMVFSMPNSSGQCQINNFAGLGTTANVNAIINCGTNTITIPSQFNSTAGGTLSGNGTYTIVGSTITISITYSLVVGTTTYSCTGTWIK
jgi:hypothetical protein